MGATAAMRLSFGRFVRSVAPTALPALTALAMVATVPLLLSAAHGQSPAPRLALIIGNRTYVDSNTPLAQPINDARALAAELRRLGFAVDLGENLTKQGMARAIAAFQGRITPGSVALFYFSGHAIQSGRQNYLIPTDAQIWSEGDVRREGVALEPIVTDMAARRAQPKIVIIDAARRSPSERRFRATPDGLAALEAPEGSLVLFSASLGKAEPDDPGDTSLFMTELLKQIAEPGLGAEEAFRRTRINVSRLSNGQRVPWMSSTLIRDFSFTRQQVVTNPPSPPPAPTPPPAPPEPGPGDHPTVVFQPDLKPGSIFRDCDTCPEMTLLPAGDFTMGSTAYSFEQPEHKVTFGKSFAIALREVRFADWDQCVAAGGCKYKPDDHGLGRGDRPVTDVSWTDAREYVAWLSKKTGQKYRLPSEAEWEYAARAGTTTAFWWGAEVGSGHANCRDCGEGSTHHALPTGRFAPNKFGLFDTAGNAAEWVEDCWNDSYRNAPRDGSAWTRGQCRQRVLRGGSFDNQARYVRSAARFRYDFDVRYYGNGFRIVREIP